MNDAEFIANALWFCFACAILTTVAPALDGLFGLVVEWMQERRKRGKK